MGVEFRDGMIPIDKLEGLFEEYGLNDLGERYILENYTERYYQNGKNEYRESEWMNYELSKEFYTIVGLANLEKVPDYFHGRNDRFIDGGFDRFQILKKIDSYNNKLIEIRKLLYQEIEGCIARDNEKADICKDDFYDRIQQIVYDTFKVLLINAGHEYWKWNEIINEIEEYVSRDTEETHRKFWVNLLHALLDCRLASRHGKVEYNLSLITAVELVDNSGYFRYSNRMWGVCLLGFLDDDPIENEQYVNLVENFDNGNNFIDELSEYYERCDNYLLANQISANMTLTCLYKINTYPNRVFYKEKVVRDMQKVLRKSNTLKKAYADMTIFGNSQTKSVKNGSGCFAIMTVNDKKYATLSGISSRRISEFHILSSLLGKDYEIVKEEGNYYLDNGYFIDLVSFANSPFLSIQEKAEINNGNYNRMFSCCERKFVKKMQAYAYHKIYVKYAPCYMCERMITEEESNNCCMIEVICPITKKYVVSRKKEYDDMAKRAMGIGP